MGNTYNDLEQEVTVHQAQLNPRSLRDTFEPREEPKNDREEHHEDGQECRRQDTGDDTNHYARQVTHPAEPLVGIAQRMNVGDGTDKGDWERPEDDQTECDAPSNGSSCTSLVRVHIQVGPDDVIGGNVSEFTSHPVGFMVS